VKNLLIRWAAVTIAVLAATTLLPNATKNGSIFGVIGFALVLGLLNATLGLILKILTLPLSILTLGLFTIVINAIIIELATKLNGAVHIHGFGSALLAAIIVSIVSTIVGWVLRSATGSEKKN
jgi:putative membrane protein